MSGINSVEQMTQGHLRNVQQLAVFYTGHNNIYAINIAKVKAFSIFPLPANFFATAL